MRRLISKLNINVEEQKKMEAQTNLERQTEERKLELGMEKRILEAEEQDKERQFQLENCTNRT